MTSRRELKNYAKQAMSGKYGLLILAFVAVQALALISSMISSALFPVCFRVQHPALAKHESET